MKRNRVSQDSACIRWEDRGVIGCGRGIDTHNMVDAVVEQYGQIARNQSAQQRRWTRDRATGGSAHRVPRALFRFRAKRGARVRCAQLCVCWGQRGQA